MKKDKKSPTQIFFVISGEVEGSYRDLGKAKAAALELCAVNSQRYYVLEVVRVWEVDVPEEPEPEIREGSLDDW